MIGTTHDGGVETEQTQAHGGGVAALAIASFTLGLLGMILSTSQSHLVTIGVGLDLAAIGLGALASYRAARLPIGSSAGSLPLTGLVLGAIGLLIGVVSLTIA